MLASRAGVDTKSFWLAVRFNCLAPGVEGCCTEDPLWPCIVHERRPTTCPCACACEDVYLTDGSSPPQHVSVLNSMLFLLVQLIRITFWPACLQTWVAHFKVRVLPHGKLGVFQASEIVDRDLEREQWKESKLIQGQLLRMVDRTCRWKTKSTSRCWLFCFYFIFCCRQKSILRWTWSTQLKMQGQECTPLHIQMQRI